MTRGYCIPPECGTWGAAEATRLGEGLCPTCGQRLEIRNSLGYCPGGPMFGWSLKGDTITLSIRTDLLHDDLPKVVQAQERRGGA